MALVAAGGLPRPWGRAAGVDGQSRGGLSRPGRRLYAALMRGPGSAGRTVLSQSEDQNHPHPVLTFVHPMSTQVRSPGPDAAKDGPRSDPQIATRTRTGSADRRQTAQRAACGDVLCRAEHFVHRATSCAEGNESRSPSAQSVTFCAECPPGRRTGPLHQEAEEYRLPGQPLRRGLPPPNRLTARPRPPRPSNGRHRSPHPGDPQPVGHPARTTQGDVVLRAQDVAFALIPPAIQRPGTALAGTQSAPAAVGRRARPRS